MIYAVTGHRPDKLGGYGFDALTNLTVFARHCLAARSPIQVITGMALGWDIAVAYACDSLGIPFIAAVPFAGQEQAWPKESQQHYRILLRKAAQVVIVTKGGYAAHKMQIRNRWMVDHGDKILALWNGSAGGTANCVAYAHERGKEVQNVWDLWKRSPNFVPTALR